VALDARDPDAPAARRFRDHQQLLAAVHTHLEEKGVGVVGLREGRDLEGQLDAVPRRVVERLREALVEEIPLQETGREGPVHGQRDVRGRHGAPGVEAAHDGAGGLPQEGSGEPSDPIGPGRVRAGGASHHWPEHVVEDADRHQAPR